MGGALLLSQGHDTGCTIEAHKFQRDLAQFDAKNAVILGVSVDTADSHKQFCTKEGLTFHLLADPDHKVVSVYGSLGGFERHDHGQPQHLPDRSPGEDRKEWVKVTPANAARTCSRRCRSALLTDYRRAEKSPISNLGLCYGVRGPATAGQETVLQILRCVRNAG